MDFNSIFSSSKIEEKKLKEDTSQVQQTVETQPTAEQTVAAQPTTEEAPLQVPQTPNVDVNAKLQDLNIANEALKKIATTFESDPKIQEMIKRYDGEKLNESVEKLEEGKYSFEKLVTKFKNSCRNVFKIVVISMAVAAVVCGAGVPVIKNLIKNSKVLKKGSKSATATNAMNYNAGPFVANNTTSQIGVNGASAETPTTEAAQPAVEASAQPTQTVATETPATTQPVQPAPVAGSNPAQLVDPSTPVTCDNSVAAQANAKPGDVIQRKDGSKYVLNQGDIDWAKNKVNANQAALGTNGASTATAQSVNHSMTHQQQYNAAKADAAKHAASQFAPATQVATNAQHVHQDINANNSNNTVGTNGATTIPSAMNYNAGPFAAPVQQNLTDRGYPSSTEGMRQNVAPVSGGGQQRRAIK